MADLQQGGGPFIVSSVGAGSASQGMRWILLAVLLLFISMGSLMQGPASLSLARVWAAVLSGGTLSGDDDQAIRIIWQLRGPRVVTAILAGAGLAAAGLLMQTYFGNPLAGPYVLGIDQGASLGVALLMLTAGGAGQATPIGRMAAAAVGAFVVLFLVLAMSRRFSDPATLLLAGLMVGYFTSAVVSILIHYSAPEQLREYAEWTFGGFTEVHGRRLHVFASAVAIGLIFAHAAVKPLNALLLGEDGARSVGMAVLPARLLVLGATALLAGSVTAFCGLVVFLDVATPHLARGLCRTSNHRLLLPMTTVLGSILAVTADLAARLLAASGTLPLNAVTSLMGAPVVLWVLTRGFFR